jgi:hypothetical protein
MEDIHVRADAHMIDTDLHITANERLALDNANGTLNESNYLLTVADMGAASGLATLDASSIITIAQLPTALQTITDAWNALPDAEKIDVYGALMLAEGAVAAAELKLKTYKEKKDKFYTVTKKADMDAFEATYKASKAVKDTAWQDKEDYAFDTGDWDLDGYEVDWKDKKEK